MIEIHNLSFHYTKGVPIFNDISTSLLPGHIYGLLGLNGIGKTTFLKLICGLLFPKTGTVTTNGFIPGERNVPFLSDIYLVTDEADLPSWRISQFVAMYGSLYPKFDSAYFDEILTTFQVDREEKIKALSYGQQKKVNIAFALATNTSVLLMDEPTNGLDIPAKVQFRKILARHITPDKTIIISTHQIRDIQHLIDHLLVLRDNTLILDMSLYELSKKVKFQQGQYADAWYTETGINGNSNIRANTDNADTPFDMELFFNALFHRPDILKKLTNPILENHE